MKNRIFLTVLLALVATVSCLFGLVGCTKDKTDDTVAVTGVTVSAQTLTLEEGESKQLTATVAPDNATDKSVTWSSSNESVATVAQDGTVTAVKEGTANITVTTTDGSKTASCTVTVEKKVIHVTGVTVSPTTLTLTEEQTQKLTATVAPDNATDKSVTWSSLNEEVATVSKDGTVTAIKEGEAEIKATTTDGSKTASCTVTVEKKVIHVTGVTVSPTTLTLTEEQTQKLTATVAPDNATDKSYTWSSLNEEVATVAQDGTVTAIKEGEAEIKVTTTDGSKTASCTVTVEKKVIHVTGVTVSPTTLTLTEKQTQKLTATVAPENATDKSVTWSSLNEKVATVSKDGTVTAVKEGTAEIKVTTTDGSKTASCTVTVEPKIVIPNIFYVTAVDNNNDPVANVYFNIGFYDSSTYGDSYLTSTGSLTSDKSRAALLKTNADGVVSLEVVIEVQKTFKLYLADPTYISRGGTTPAVPKGYSVNFGTSAAGLPIYSLSFVKDDDGVYSVTANFKLDNSWGALFEPDNNLVYYRYYPDFYKDELKIEYIPYEKNAQAGRLNYFTFAPYRAPMPSGDISQKVVDAVVAKGNEAASGIYRISWTASDPTANVHLILYSFAGGNYFQSNDDGSPTDAYILMHTGDRPLTDEAQLQKLYEQHKSLYGSDASDYNTWLEFYINSFSGSNSITLELSSDNSSTVYSLGYVASKNCKVTISIERIGEAAIWTSEEVTVKMPTGEPNATKEAGNVINAPLSANTVVVKGDDGYYHLGNKNGAKIYVQLKKGTRVNNLSMLYLSDIKNTEGRPQFVIIDDVYDEESKTGIHYYYDYGKVVSGYAALANSDGLYPVNDMLKLVLEHFCKSMIGYNQYGENYWLAACQYYGEIPDGSEAKPYYLFEGDTITLNNGSAWVVFVPSETGYYEFNCNVPGSILAKDMYYISLEAQTEFKFKVTGTGTTFKLEIKTIPDGRHLRYYVTDLEDTQIWRGTDELPLNLSNLLVYMVTIDHAAYNSAITVDLKFTSALLKGNYVIHVAGSEDYSIQIKVENGYVDYDGTAIALSSTSSTLIHLDSEENSTFFIWLEKV